jgi:ribulose bisphosphate carboxylase small subunit
MKPAPKLSLAARKRAIRAILEARFSIGAFEKLRREDAAYWASARNDMARGIYGEAMREKQRLAKAPDARLAAEVAAIGV